MKENAKVGRPKVPEYRKIRMRLSRVEDALLPLILQLSNENEKNQLLNAFEELKNVDVKTDK